jgi:hypothetical protein
MSQTPQGVDAQEAVVDITTNNYQKAIEGFFSHYCSYALTIYFAELQAVKGIAPSAEARIALRKAGLNDEEFNEDGTLALEFKDLATEYFVRCIPGSLVELEDEKQMRILNQLFVPLSQAMPAIAASQDQEAMKNASKAMQYIVIKQIELSGSVHAKDIGLMMAGQEDEVTARDARLKAAEDQVAQIGLQMETETDLMTEAMVQMREQISLLIENQQQLLSKLGVLSPEPTPVEPVLGGEDLQAQPSRPTVVPASA